MAESAVIAAVSPILKLVIDKLNSGFCEELGLVRGVNSDIGRLQSVLSTINAVLDDAQRRRSISDEALTDWLGKLKDAAFDADDVVDEFQYEALRRRIQRRNQRIGKDLTALTTFAIADEKLSCLPEGILQLCMPTLERVYFTCPNLKFISGEEGDKQQQPPTFFVTIQNLHIVSLELTALPEWLGNLTSLQSLSISSCSPDLERRCERERGEDWPMIAHIPDIEIWPKKDDRAETSQRPITRSIRNFRLTSCCTGRG